jgi:hypothetical protein
MARYQPPKQSGLGQLVDSLFIMALVFLSLLAPVLLKKEASAPEPAAEQAQQAPAPPAATWDDLQQNEVARAQWERLGHTPETAKPIIENRFDYTIQPLPLIVTAAVILVYFFFVFRVSEREYRQVIAERFDAKKD